MGPEPQVSMHEKVENVEGERAPAASLPVTPIISESPQVVQLKKQVTKVHQSGKDKIINTRTTYKKSPSFGSKMPSKEFRLKGQRLFIATGYSAHKPTVENRARGIASINNHIILKDNSGLPVVQDPVKKVKGVATGHIIVKVKPNIDLREIAKTYNLSVEHSVPHLNLVSFTPSNKKELLDISVKLSESDLFDSVKLDISFGGPRAK